MDEITQSAVLGFAIKTCQRVQMTDEDTAVFMATLKGVQDRIDPEYAEQIYNKSPY